VPHPEGELRDACRCAGVCSRPCTRASTRADLPAEARASANCGSRDRGRPIHHRGGQARCPTDKVVWVNTKSHVYHYAGTRSYGTTKQGAYMCEADASAAGDRATKSRVGQPKQQP
jgi:hypothetical protein